ncbi:survival protein sure-like phosphatase/nucleotidase [Pholiota conissans]|uniref:Survival protein sure-like phosphatase/nucleotidase n=1 Tax=Pholiota conissans TaxID=109636 RepID=A0A9P6D2P3_9AGAR|nr:survival protein sure-like phosphatase/nucleotidase [Pholiota conissans]
MGCFSYLLALSFRIIVTSRVASSQKILLTNDDGWAVAQIRAEYTALTAAGFDVILSAPAENESGTGSSTSTPTTLKSACEFNTCAAGSPAEGANSTDSRINYVNGFPVDSVRYGIQTLAPKFFGSKPDLVVSGSNIGNNLGSTVLISGTVGAASEAALEGIPSIAFSGSSGSQVSYTTLSQTTSSSTKAANIYTTLVVKFTQTLLANPTPLLPSGISLNVNFASISNCASVSDFKFVLTRINADKSATDVTTCGTNHLTAESTAITKGCIATVSVFDASTKGDVDAATQGAMLRKLTPILTCL